MSSNNNIKYQIVDEDSKLFETTTNPTATKNMSHDSTTASDFEKQNWYIPDANYEAKVESLSEIEKEWINKFLK